MVRFEHLFWVGLVAIFLFIAILVGYSNEHDSSSEFCDVLTSQYQDEQGCK